MNDDVEQRLNRLTPRGVRPELREVVLGVVADELQVAPKGHSSPSPGQRPGEAVPIESISSAQRANDSPNCWPVGPANGQGLSSPGRCPGLGEPQGLRPIVLASEGIVTTTADAPATVAIPRTDSPWLRRAAMTVAASLLLGICLNVWVSNTSERRFAQLFGPPPISKQAMEIAKDVESISDAATGRWVYNRLTIARRSGEGNLFTGKYQDTIKQLIDELQTVSKDSYHDSEMDRDRTGWIGRDRFDNQCRLRRDFRFTA
jgi:hypothetical protein